MSLISILLSNKKKNFFITSIFIFILDLERLQKNRFAFCESE